MLYRFYVCLFISWNLLSSPITSYLQPVLQPLDPTNVGFLEQIAVFGKGGFIDLDYSPDGTVLAIASDRGAWLYDANDLNKEPHHLEGNVDFTSDVTFSPDGSTIAASSYDHTIWLWDVPTRQQIARLVGHQKPVTSIAFSPDSTLLVSGSSDNSVKLWDINQQRTITTLDVHRSNIEGVVFSPDGELIASVSHRQFIVWNIRTQEVTSWDAAFFRELAFLADGKTIITAHDNGAIVFWDVETKEYVIQWDDYARNQIALSPDRRFLAYNTSDDLVIIRDLQNPTNTVTIQGEYYALTFSPDGFSLAGSTERGERIDIWNFQTQIQVDQSPLSASWIARVGLHPEKSLIYGVTIWGRVETWDIDTQQMVGRLQLPFDIALRMSFLAEQELLATSQNGSLTVWDVSQGLQITQIEDEFDRNTPFVLAPTGELLAWVIDNSVVVWNIEDNQQVSEGTLPYSSNNLSFSPNSSVLAIGLRTNEVVLWDVAQNQQIAQFAVYPAGISNLLFSSDGKKLLTVSDINQNINILQLWDVQSGTLLSETNIQDVFLKELCGTFSPNGGLLALCSLADDLLIYDGNTLELITQLNYHTDTVYDVTFSEYGDFILSGSLDGTIRLLGIP